MKLTEPQQEVLRFLARGHHIYLNKRGKWMLTSERLSDGTILKALSGHTNDSRGPDTHLYRPTVHFLIDNKIIKGYFNKDNMPCYKLNTKNVEYAEEIKLASVEGALGVTRVLQKKGK